MAIPDYESLMRTVLQAFADGARNVSEVLPTVQSQFEITDEEAAELLPSGRVTIIASRVHWARTYLSKADLLTSPKRNLHVITQRGRELLQQCPDRIDNDVLTQFDGFKTWKERSQAPADGDTGLPVNDTLSKSPINKTSLTPEEVIATAARTIEAELSDALLQEVLGLSPTRFERLILDLLRAMGYGGGADSMYRETAQSGDGGIDGIIDEDALGLDAVYIQAKRYAPENKIGREALQAFIGSLTGEGASKGVFVTTSDFSKPARDYVHRVQQRVVLINGDRLARLMIAHEVGVRARQVYVIRSVDEDYFAE